MMPLDELLDRLQDISYAQLRGWRRKKLALALFGVDSMRRLMDSPLAGNSRTVYRQERWRNVRAELRNVRRILQKSQVKLPEVILANLDYYCECAAPDDFC